MWIESVFHRSQLVVRRHGERVRERVVAGGAVAQLGQMALTGSDGELRGAHLAHVLAVQGRFHRGACTDGAVLFATAAAHKVGVL